VTLKTSTAASSCSAPSRVPERPHTGDVVEWWTLQPHPIHAYVQRHHAEFYERASCEEVLGPSRKSGKDFVEQWLVASWYEPSGSQTAGGRITTAELRAYLDGDARHGVRVCGTFDEVRALLVAAHREQSAIHLQTSQDCDRRAEEAITMPEPPARKRR
jgi:hypothetical protein